MVSLFAQNQRTPKREAERLKTLAESLQKGGQYRGNEVVSGRVVEQSPWEHLARGLQTAAGGYFAGQSQAKADEDEANLQAKMAEALSQWGSDPQAAAMALASDPRTSDMAAKIMAGELDYSRQKERWGQQDALQRELASMRASSVGNMPAPMQIANQMFELEQMMNNPNLPEEQRFLAERQYNLLGQAAKTYGFDRGLQAGPMGGYEGVFGPPQMQPAGQGYNDPQSFMPSAPDFQNIQPVTMGQNGEMQAPVSGQQSPSAPLNPMQYQEMMQQSQFNDLIGGLTGQPQQPMQQDPMAAHAAAVQAQQQQIGVSPMQRPELSMTAPRMGEIPGYGQAAASIAAQKAEAEAAAKSRGTFNEEGKQGLIRTQRLLQSKELQDGMLNDKISSIRNRANALTTGFTGSLLSIAPGSPGYDLRADVDTLLANAGFDRLQEMRDNSPTGGALGQVSNIELGLLQSAAQNLKASQGKEQFLRNLDNFERQRASSLANIRAAYEQDYQRFGGAQDRFLPPPSVQSQTAPTQDINAEIEALERELGIR